MLRICIRRFLYNSKIDENSDFRLCAIILLYAYHFLELCLKISIDFLAKTVKNQGFGAEHEREPEQAEQQFLPGA